MILEDFVDIKFSRTKSWDSKSCSCFSSFSNVVSVVGGKFQKHLDDSHLCCGNPDDRYVPLALALKGKFVDSTDIYLEKLYMLWCGLTFNVICTNYSHC